VRDKDEITERRLDELEGLPDAASNPGFALWLTLLAAVGSMAEAVLTLRRIRR